MGGLPRLLVDQVRRLDGVREGRSRVGNPQHRAWFVGEKEFAHLHDNGCLDIRLPKDQRPEKDTDERFIFRKHASAWVEFRLNPGSDADIREALQLLKAAAQAARDAS